jgi:translation initiation factor IF-1
VTFPPGPPGGASIDSASLGDAPRGVEATITEVLPNALFRAKLKDGRQVLAHASVAFRIRETRVVPGDRIVLQLSPLDDRQGRIIRRA